MTSGNAPTLDDATTADLVDQTCTTTTAVVDALSALDREPLEAPSELPGWSRLTVACHLRYGAEALLRMTADTIAGRPTAHYPEGRASQRPSTLVPRPGENGQDVVASLQNVSVTLHAAWKRVADWTVEVSEPEGVADLGPVPLQWLVLLRLTEVEVHGTDLGLGLGPWSELFVRHVLPMRLSWLPRRRSNHRPFTVDLDGSWLLVPTDGGQPTLLVTEGAHVTVVAVPDDTDADEVIRAPAAELLALLLGRSGLPQAAAFARLFPGP